VDKPWISGNLSASSQLVTSICLSVSFLPLDMAVYSTLYFTVKSIDFNGFLCFQFLKRVGRSDLVVPADVSLFSSLQLNG